MSLSDGAFEEAKQNIGLADEALTGLIAATNFDDKDNFYLITEMLAGDTPTLMGVLARLTQMCYGLKDVSIHLLAGWACFDGETWVAINGDTKPVSALALACMTELHQEIEDLPEEPG